MKAWRCVPGNAGLRSAAIAIFLLTAAGSRPAGAQEFARLDSTPVHDAAPPPPIEASGSFRNARETLIGESTAVATLNSAAAGLAFARAYATVASVDDWQHNRVDGRIWVFCSTEVAAANGGSCPFQGASIVAPPWEKAGAPTAYIFATAETLGMNALTASLHRSRNPWARRLWFVPQLARSGWSVYSLQHNLSNRREPPAPVITITF